MTKVPTTDIGSGREACRENGFTIISGEFDFLLLNTATGEKEHMVFNAMSVEAAKQLVPEGYEFIGCASEHVIMKL